MSSEIELEQAIETTLDGWDLIKDGGPKQIAIAIRQLFLKGREQ